MMNKKIFVGLVTALLALSIGSVVEAQPNFLAATVTNPVTEEPKNTVTIPSVAVEVAPNIFYLGSAIDEGEVVEGYAIIDYKKGFGKPPWAGGPGGPGGNGGDTSDCYSFLAKGAKWKTVEPWVVNTANDEGLSSAFVFSNLAEDISKWEDAADGAVDGSISTDILGDGSTTTETLEADTDRPDDQNEVYFGDVGQSGAIAVTIVWGIFRGPPSKRKLVEWDQVYDQVDFDWSSSGEAGKMDFENIATHELGHSVGLGDLYEDKCSEQTMYGYAHYGETKKRTLEDGDINGVYQLYK
jgi:hypothetical protein